MNKTCQYIWMGVFIFLVSVSLVSPRVTTLPAKIKRVTFSGNHKVLSSSISGNGQAIIYILEMKSDGNTPTSVRFLQLDTGQEVEIFSEADHSLQKPFGQGRLMLGSKPPLLSGDGRTAVFLLSLGEPENIIDHFLAVANTADKRIQLFSFPHESLKGLDAGPMGFQSSNWERISHVAINDNGTRIACAVKGHLGPRRFGSCSGIVLLDLKKKTRSMALSPVFADETWKWPTYPRNPLLGGGWAFALSGNGDKLLFGAQSSEDKADYDLYVMTWPDGPATRITRFSDRWFSMADIGFDGEQVVFFYSGNKEQGIGTYRVKVDGSGLQKITSPSTPRIELYGFAGKSSCLFYKNVYQGMMMVLSSGKEYLILDPRVPGYASGVIPMDFPQVPAFWTPRGISYNGDKVLLSGPPTGRQSPEIYMLSIDVVKAKQ